MAAKVWLVGAGGMARDYIKVLEGLGTEYEVIGRGQNSANECSKLTEKKIHLGGIDSFISTQPEVASHAIVAVGVEQLFHCASQLLKHGIKNILLEKPGGVDKNEIASLSNLAKDYDANVLIAYNRRFYQSTQQARKIIEKDGGLRSCIFEFTEWSHVIENLDKPDSVFQHWFIGNSTHVVDLAFHLAGKPKQLTSFTQGSLTWHKAASQFCGAGISEDEVMFSYFADWQAPGRWSLEFLTAKHRLIFKPMEALKIIKLGTVAEVEVELETELDSLYKPGLFKQTETFLNNDLDNHCTIFEQESLIDTYYKMANYE